MYCVSDDPHFRPSCAHLLYHQFSTLLSPHPRSKPTYPAMCSQLPLFHFPSKSHSKSPLFPKRRSSRSRTGESSSDSNKDEGSLTLLSSSRDPSHFRSGSTVTYTGLYKTDTTTGRVRTVSLQSASTCSQRYQKQI